MVIYCSFSTPLPNLSLLVYIMPILQRPSQTTTSCYHDADEVTFFGSNKILCNYFLPLWLLMYYYICYWWTIFLNHIKFTSENWYIIFCIFLLLVKHIFFPCLFIILSGRLYVIWLFFLFYHPFLYYFIRALYKLRLLTFRQKISLL